MEMPKVDLTTFFLSVSAAAMQSLEHQPPDLMMAKHNIDLLVLLEEKTKGNRTAEEEQLLAHLLYQLRMSYVQADSSAQK
jgi:hypothetical protein